MPKSFAAKISDIHTHNPNAPADAIINLDRYGAMRPDRLYSVGWHPWWGEPDWEWIEQTAARPQVVMIGECGIDKLRSPLPPERQLEITERHALMAERLGKPLLLHIVGAWNEIIALRRKIKPAQPWIIHGFRGKPQLARQLVNAGFYLSLGQKFNPAVAETIDPDRIFRETDENF